MPMQHLHRAPPIQLRLELISDNSLRELVPVVGFSASAMILSANNPAALSSPFLCMMMCLLASTCTVRKWFADLIFPPIVFLDFVCAPSMGVLLEV